MEEVTQSLRSATTSQRRHQQEENRIDQQREEQLAEDADNDDVSTPFLQHHRHQQRVDGPLIEKELEPSSTTGKLKTWNDVFRGPQVRYHPEGGRGLEPDSALAWFVFLATVVLEVFTATGNVFLVIYGSASEIPFKEFVIAGYPRMIFWIGLSYLTHGKRFWEQYLKVDHPFAATITTVIAYYYLILSNPLAPVSTVRMHALVLFPLVYVCFTGNLRVLTKWYPWSRRKIYCYKLVRVYHLIFFTLNQVYGGNFMNGDNTTIAYFGTTLYLLRELLGLILRREVGLKPQFKEQEDREKELKERLRRQRDDLQMV